MPFGVRVFNLKTIDMKKIVSGLIFLPFLLLSTACNEPFSEHEPQQDAVAYTRTGIALKVLASVKLSETNPLAVGSYNKSDGSPAIDYVTLFTANISGPSPASFTETILWNDADVSAILSNPEKYIRPLQDKGIKVLYGLQGNKTGLGFANLSDLQVEDFAGKVAAQVTAAGLDGVELIDEWVEYGSRGYPFPNTSSYDKLVIRLRELMPDKIITMKDVGYTANFSSEALAAIDFGYYAYFSLTSFCSTPGMGLPASKWAPISFDLQYSTNRYVAQVRAYSKRAVEQGYGAIFLNNLRDDMDHTAILNAIASGSQELTVTHNGEWFEKDW